MTLASRTNPLADARGYNPVPSGRGLLQCKVARASACSIGFSRWPARRRLKPALQTKVRATIILLVFAMLASAAPLDLSAWKYRKRIPLTPGDGLAVVKLDREVYKDAQKTFAELRVVRDGEEVPWVLDYRFVDGSHLDSTTMVDKGIVEGKNLRFTMVASSPHNRVNIGVRKHNFRQTVQIEASQDGEHWDMLRSDATIVDFSQDGRDFTSTDVPYPVSTRRFLRVTILGWTDLDAVHSAALQLVGPPPTDRWETLSTVNPTVSEDPATRSTVLTLDQGQWLPIGRLRISSTTPFFNRGVIIDTSDDGVHWVTGPSQFIRRTRNPGFADEDLEISLYRGFGSRYQRLRVYNGNDKPLQFGPIRCEGRIGFVKFRAAEAGTYWLYYGNSAEMMYPEYDLVKTLSHLEEAAAANAQLGPAELNPTYHPPPPLKKPWSEQHPAILYTVLGGAVLALGIATFRFAARLRPTS